MSRAGLEPATTALRDQNGLIASVPFRDFSVSYGNPVSVPCSSLLPFGHRLGHNRLRRTIGCLWFPSPRRLRLPRPGEIPGFGIGSHWQFGRRIVQLHPRTMLPPLCSSVALSGYQCRVSTIHPEYPPSPNSSARRTRLFGRYPDFDILCVEFVALIEIVSRSPLNQSGVASNLGSKSLSRLVHSTPMERRRLCDSAGLRLAVNGPLVC